MCTCTYLENFSNYNDIETIKASHIIKLNQTYKYSIPTEPCNGTFSFVQEQQLPMICLVARSLHATAIVVSKSHSHAKICVPYIVNTLCIMTLCCNKIHLMPLVSEHHKWHWVNACNIITNMWLYTFIHAATHWEAHNEHPLTVREHQHSDNTHSSQDCQ